MSIRFTRRPERVTVVALTTDLTTGNGIGTYVSSFLASLHRVRPGWTCSVITLRSDGVAASTSFPVVEAGSRPAFGGWALWHVISSRPTEILVFHMSLLPLARVCALLCGARLHLFTYGWDVSNNRRVSERTLVNGVDHIYAISRWTALAVERFHLSFAGTELRSPVTVLPPTFDEATYFRDVAAGAGFRSRLAIPPDCKVLLTVGRLDPGERQKGHDRVLSLLPTLRRQFPGLTYVIAGAGADRDRLRQLADEHGVAAFVRFIGFCDDLRSCYSASDAFVMPSTQEGFGIVYLEAMGCGTPVVAGGVDGSPSALAWGRYGYLCDPYCPPSIEAAVTTALRSPESGDPRGDPAWLAEQVRDTFGRDAFDRRVSAALSGLTAGDSKPNQGRTP